MILKVIALFSSRCTHESENMKAQNEKQRNSESKSEPERPLLSPSKSSGNLSLMCSQVMKKQLKTQ